jgi:hypothetical protein
MKSATAYEIAIQQVAFLTTYLEIHAERKPGPLGKNFSEL